MSELDQEILAAAKAEPKRTVSAPGPAGDSRSWSRGGNVD